VGQVGWIGWGGLDWAGGRSLEWSDREEGAEQGYSNGMDRIVRPLKKQKRGDSAGRRLEGQTCRGTYTTPSPLFPSRPFLSRKDEAQNSDQFVASR
jgi:hypothetical protein